MSRKRRHLSASVCVLAFLAFTAGSYAVWRYLVYSSLVETNEQSVKVVETHKAELPPGFAKFTFDNLNLEINYPMSEDPVEAKNPPEKDALASLTTRSFSVNIWDGKAFGYKQLSRDCVYDRALQQFAGSAGDTCSIAKTSLAGALAFDAGSEDNGLHKFVYLMPIKFDQYFLEANIFYQSECQTDPSIYHEVCQARARDNKQKLTDFMNALVVNNRPLFE